MDSDETRPNVKDDKKDLEALQTQPSHSEGTVVAVGGNDATNANLQLISNAIEEIGMGSFQWKLSFSCAFGFLVDQMLLVSVSLSPPQAALEFGPRYQTLISVASYGGLLVGAVTVGFLADLVGRKLVWQISLFGVSVFTMVLAGSPNWVAMNVLLAICGFFGGGNLAIDLTLLNECLPVKWSFLLTGMAATWGLGNAIAGLIAWPLLVNFGCPAPSTCSKADNMGWRYLYITIGGLCLVMAIIRSFTMGSHESPKWLVSQGRYAEAAAVLNSISNSNGSDRHFGASDFSVDENLGCLKDSKVNRFFHQAALLYKGPRKLWLMSGITCLWALIGIVYPLYTIFLTYYLESHGAKLGNGSSFITYRDWTVSSIVGIWGPFISMAMVSVRWLRSRRSMAIMAAMCAVFSGLFTLVRNEAENLAFSCMINLWLNALYAIIYSYTPQVLSTENRAFGCGLLMACGRCASLAAPFIATFADVTSSTPIWVTCALYVVIGIISLCLPVDTV